MPRWLVFVIVIISGYALLNASGCRPRKQQLITGRNFCIQTTGSITTRSITYQINRTLCSSASGSMLALTTIRQKSANALDFAQPGRILYEFFEHDSVFSYDSADSTCFALPLNSLALQSLALFPFSAQWLVKAYNDPACGEKIKSPKGTGLPATLYRNGDTTVWLNQMKPVAIQIISKKIRCSEQVVRTITDTSFAPAIFSHPLHYRRLKPSQV